MGHSKKWFLLTLASFILFNVIGLAAAAQIRSLKFSPGQGGSQFEIHYSGDIHFNVLNLHATKQLVVEADNVLLDPQMTKIIDSSIVNSPVIQITPYNSGGKSPKAKFVVQLKKDAKFSSSQLPGKFILDIHSDSQENSAALTPASPKTEHKLKSISSDWVESDQIQSLASADDKSGEVAQQLTETLNAEPDRKVYHGSRVSFEASNADVHDIFRLVGEASGLNVLTASDVRFSVSLSLKDIPWDQLLDIVLQQGQLKAAVSGNVVRVTTLEAYNKEQEQKKAAIRLGEDLDPVIMAIIPLSYAKANAMQKIISDLLVKPPSATPPAGALGAAASAAQAANANKPGEPIQAFVKGQIQVDDRSNSLVITNTKDAIERIRRLVKELDVALPQVLIDSKIVIAGETFSKSIGLQYGAYATNPQQTMGTSLSFNGGQVGTGASTASSSGAVPGPAFALTSAAQTATQGASGGIGFQQMLGPLNLNMALSVAEANGISKTVGSPRVVVNNKQSATVTDGVQIPTVTPGTANSPPTTTYTTAVLSLNVTPQITSAGSVLMDVAVHKDAPSSSGNGTIDTKTLTTQVLVDSGATLVLGGVYQYTGNANSNGIPGLMDLPIIGSLFRVDNKSVTKEELMVFITPQILDTGNQGITDKM